MFLIVLLCALAIFSVSIQLIFVFSVKVLFFHTRFYFILFYFTFIYFIYFYLFIYKINKIKHELIMFQLTLTN